MRSIAWRHFEWPWRIPNPVFKVTAFWSRISQKRCILWTMFLWNTNRKQYAIYRMVPLSIILSDLWPRFQGYDILLIRLSILLRRAVFLIVDFKKCRNLEIGVRGHSRLLKVVPRTIFEIWLQKCRENRVRGPSRSLEMSPLDSAHMSSYWRSIVTMALSRVVSEIFSVEEMSWKLYRSVDRVWFPISVL